jgi:hypothetical protein
MTAIQRGTIFVRIEIVAVDIMNTPAILSAYVRIAPWTWRRPSA